MARCLRPFILLGLAITSAVFASTHNLSTTNHSVSAALSALPLGFEKNQGQADARVLYKAHAPSSTVFLTRNGATLAWSSGALRMLLAGANSESRITAEQQLPGKVNYLVGNAKRWHTDIPTFERVKYSAVYPGVDLVFYGKQGRLEYDFAVAPGADVRKIRLRTEGADSVKIAGNGDLLLGVGKQEVRWKKPVTYQEVKGKRNLVPSKYKLLGDQIAFVVGAYDRSRTLIIDPTLVYSTYLGGSTDADPTLDPGGPGTATSGGNAIAVDSSGNAYVAGDTSATDFPVTAGAYDTTQNATNCSPYGGNCGSGFVTKINPSGTALVYSTYLGNGTVAGMAIDGGGRAYVVGSFRSDQDSVPMTANAFQSSAFCESAGYAYLSVLNNAGNGLVYSTAYGRQAAQPCAGGDAGGESVAVGATGVAYVVGNTNTAELVTRNAYQSVYSGGDNDAWLAKFDPSKSGDASLLYATYLGGPGWDIAYDVATEGGRAYVVGEAGPEFPTTVNARMRSISSSRSGFVAKIDTNASGVASLVWSTYVANSPNNFAKAISLLGTVPYVGGGTECCGFPTTPGAFQRLQKSCLANPCYDAWVAKLTSDGSGLQYSTVLSGSGDEAVQDLAVDGAGLAWVTGGTASSDYPTTSDAIQRQYHPATCNATFNIPCTDVFFTGIKASGSSLAYSTYFGNVGNDVGLALAVRNGFAYLTGITGSAAFPTTSGAYKRTRTGREDAFIAKFSTSPSCSAPTTSRTIHVCSPLNSSSVKSPVHVQATAKAGASAIKSMQVYVDGVRKFDAPNSTRIDTSVSMAAGARRVTVQAIDSSGAFKTTVNITVQ